MTRINVLDQGYIEFIEAWGRGRQPTPTNLHERDHVDYERSVIEAARQSTQGAFRGWEQDQKLLTHLYKNRHSTPFEFAGMVIEVQAPIFVFREWHRHRTQSYNEMSARYAPLPDRCYVPDWHNLRQRGMATAEKNKQALGVSPFDEAAAWTWRQDVIEAYKALEKLYLRGLSCGVPKELARITMPVGHYSRMRASGNLRNWLAFMTLRCDPKTQWETQQYANAVMKLIAETFPRTFDLWYAEFTHA